MCAACARRISTNSCNEARALAAASPIPEVSIALSATPKGCDIMKRKKSPDLAVTQTCCKVAKQDIRVDVKPCHLQRILAQYGLLISLVSNLAPKDLFALAATSKATYQVIFSSETSRLNLLGKMPCDGAGIAIRQACHKKSPFSTGPKCTEYVQCGSNDSTRVVESQHCVGCDHITCDECRVHCVYQSITELPSSPDELPTYSGFALLSKVEMGILTPAHFNGTQTIINRPYHDQGYLDIPLDLDTYASPESIDEILDYDLGEGSLRLFDSSDEPHPSPIIEAFWEYTEMRKITTCSFCRSLEHAKVNEQRDNDFECHCTLRAHLLDRWTCLQCFQTETKRNTELCKLQQIYKVQCNCEFVYGVKKVRSATRPTCLWCWGIVRG